MAHPWHDIALPPDDQLDVFPVVIEVPRGEKTALLTFRWVQITAI
jgi:hypothetical protein